MFAKGALDELRHLVARDLAGADLRAVGRDPRQAVALQAVGLRADEGAGDVRDGQSDEADRPRGGGRPGRIE